MRLFIFFVLCLLNPASWAAPAAPVSYSLADHAAHLPAAPRLGKAALLPSTKVASPRKEQALKKKATFSKKKPKTRKHLKAKRAAGLKKAQPRTEAKHQPTKPALALVKAQPRSAKAAAPVGPRPKGLASAHKRKTPPRVPELSPQNRAGLPELPRRPVPLDLRLPRIAPPHPGGIPELESRHSTDLSIPVLNHLGPARNSPGFVSKLGPVALELLASAVATLKAKGSVHLPLYADRHSSLRLELAATPRGKVTLLTLNMRLT